MPVRTRKRKAALEESRQAGTGPEPSSANTKRDTDRDGPVKRQKNLAVRSRDDEEVPAQEDKSKANVVRFDDEGNADKELAVPVTARPVPAVLGDEDEGSDGDGDEAPEAVSTAKVAREMMESARAAGKIAQEQAAASKRKRRQRDAFFKKQALERKDANPIDDVPSVAGPERKRAERAQIPDVLPAEFLTDSSSEDEGVSSRGEGEAKRRGRTVPSVERKLARQGRGPRDEVIGTTVYRISRDVDERMAPKVKKYARSSKDALLRRGREPVKGRNSGFFKK